MNGGAQSFKYTYQTQQHEDPQDLSAIAVASWQTSLHKRAGEYDAQSETTHFNASARALET